jgi:mono/diheme cytochrome c family protein
MKCLRCLLTTGAVLAILGGSVVFYLLRQGVSAREQPPAIEVGVARFCRHLAMPGRERSRANPVPLSDDVLARSRAHFADHCASCHGNDGRGQTSLGRNLYPKAPDMTAPRTQSMSDGELFATIKNGVRLTGMPAWGDDSAESDRETWELVHFVRSLPKLTKNELSEMESLNPKSPAEFRKEEEERRFLEGDDEPAGKHH